MPTSDDDFPGCTRRRLLLAGALLAGRPLLHAAEPAAADAAATDPPVRTALDFPGSAAVASTLRFRFRQPLPPYPATYIWRVLPRRQAGYYTAFFWGNDDGLNDLRTFLWTPDRDADSYYGAHPYPDPPPRGTDHRWEISIDREDITRGAVDYGRWHTQAFRTRADAGGKTHEFYWDLPFTDAAHRIGYRASRHWGNRMPPAPALTWGDAPWAPGKEVWCGLMRGIQVYTACLSVAEILREAHAPGSTRAGAASLWYLNVDPRPDDIRDRSGRGHHPEWVGKERPALWVG